MITTGAFKKLDPYKPWVPHMPSWKQPFLSWEKGHWPRKRQRERVQETREQNGLCLTEKSRRVHWPFSAATLCRDVCKNKPSFFAKNLARQKSRIGGKEGRTWNWRNGRFLLNCFIKSERETWLSYTTPYIRIQLRRLENKPYHWDWQKYLETDHLFLFQQIIVLKNKLSWINHN